MRLGKVKQMKSETKVKIRHLKLKQKEYGARIAGAVLFEHNLCVASPRN